MCSARNRALQLDEICREIVAHIPSHTEKGETSYHRSLARLARTSNAFFVPAIDALWYTLSSTKPIIHLLDFLPFGTPAKAFAETASSRNDRTCPLWRLHYYAGRIRKLSVTQYVNQQRELAAYARLRSVSGFQPLFTRLNELEIVWSDIQHYQDLLDFTSLVAAPSLHRMSVKLSLEQRHGLDMLLPVLEPFICKSASLSSLKVELPEGQDANVTLLQKVMSFKRLEALELRGIFVSVTHLNDVLGHSDSLCYLNAQIADNNLSGSLSHSPALFRCLNVLETTGTPVHIMELVKILPETLTKLSLPLQTLSSLEINDICIRIGHRFRSFGTLKTLCISTPFQSNIDDDHPSTGLFTIRPLFDIDTLEDVNITFGEHILVWKDDDVLTLATAWPRLKSLMLDWVPADIPQVPTLHTLVLFAQRCSNLRSLILREVRMSRIREATSLKVHPHGLRSLQFIHPPTTCQLRDLNGVHYFLDRLFPYCEIVAVGTDDGWRHVLTEIRYSRTGEITLSNIVPARRFG
ncbi:hypothetical protein POSPLADRAFT_1047564 [Postia placenta MAD-698-R-SB12]|uniref:F-box domain-containing protein n=1 Tax=Postia placenta MAD-698-R-SB12 TaxID=670580 RepID=A0A1X6MYA0_9APHY|nr:hypothetical protein POSPLADRAFT_1047564 [Postia placenta MAD-698-R-SB12]OSX61351.1 hypothetical protein POSPLADRAFT_1047564 [Postia placenta MAD-698-R-SB12]